MNNISKNNIYLEKEDHIYRLEDDMDFEFTSVTTFVHQFFEEFDADFVARKLTSTHPKYKHMTGEELLGEWRQRADYGTYVHEEIETYINDNKQPEDRKSLRAVQWLNGYKMQSNFDLISDIDILSSVDVVRADFLIFFLKFLNFLAISYLSTRSTLLNTIISSFLRISGLYFSIYSLTLSLESNTLLYIT